MTEPIIFDDLSFQEIPVVIAGKQYILREANGDAACRYRNALLSSTQLNSEGKPERINNLADVEPFLVSLCLFDAETKKPVPLQTIRSWPAKIVSTLFEKAKEISRLEEKVEQETEEELLKRKEEIESKLAKIRGTEENPT